MTHQLTIRYIKAKYNGETRQGLFSLRADVAKELREIKSNKSEIFNTYKGVHGRFHHSQLDVLDIRENKMCALFDNISDMIGGVA